jgi:GT2 family glycosyltransferase
VTELSLSIVIPCRDGEGVIGAQLQALSEEPPGDWEIVVVDNGSRDSTAAVVEAAKAELASLRLLDASDAPGRHHACNVGARGARGASLLFLDADDVIEPGLVAVMSQALEESEVAVPRYEYGAVNPGVAGELAYQTERVEEVGGFLPAGSGSGFGIRASVFDEIGGFDETMDYAEDVDLSWRATLAGHDVRLVRDAVLHKRQRTGPRGMFRQHFNYGVATVWLFRKFRRLGMPRRGARDGAADWWRAIAALPFLGRADVRIRWLRRVARACGRMWGTARSGTLYL